MENEIAKTENNVAAICNKLMGQNINTADTITAMNTIQWGDYLPVVDANYNLSGSYVRADIDTDKWIATHDSMAAIYRSSITDEKRIDETNGVYLAESIKMKKFQLFTRKPGQLAVGNKYAIYDTLAEAQEELRRWLKIEFEENDNISYLDESIITDLCILYKGYAAPGWYKCEGSYYAIVMFDDEIDSDDFTEFSYDLTKYSIEEIEVEDER
jgi:hypothetical protein